MTTGTSLKGKQLYVDANIFIYAAEAFEKYSALCTTILAMIENGEVNARTSELTLAEVLVKPFRDSDASIVEAYQQAVSEDAGVQLYPVTRGVLIAAASLRAKLSLSLPDAIHVATAQELGCDILLTADNRLRVPKPIMIVSLDELLKA